MANFGIVVIDAKFIKLKFGYIQDVIYSEGLATGI